MAWMIGRTAVLADPERARAKVLEKLSALSDIDEAEGLVVPILIDAILMAESYRGAPHQRRFHQRHVCQGRCLDPRAEYRRENSRPVTRLRLSPLLGVHRRRATERWSTRPVSVDRGRSPG